MADSLPSSKRRRTDHSETRSNVVEASNSQNLSPLVVFAHGAGAPSTSDWMIRWKEMLGKALNAVEVVTFDYPYLAGGKRGAPPKAEKLVDFHADVVKKAVAKHPGHPLILVGKSMGSSRKVLTLLDGMSAGSNCRMETIFFEDGRVSCMVASQMDISASAIVCLGYPLKGMKGAIRDEILVSLTVPIMFVQGSKDGLCPLDKLEAVRKRITPINDLHVIEGGDHSFKIAKKHLLATETTQTDAEESAVQSIASFVSNNL